MIYSYIKFKIKTMLCFPLFVLFAPARPASDAHTEANLSSLFSAHDLRPSKKFPFPLPPSPLPPPGR